MKKKKLLVIAAVIAVVAAYFVWDQMLRTAPAMKRLTAEYRVNAVDLQAEEIIELVRNSFKASFLEKEDKRRHLDTIADLVKTYP